MKTKLTIIAGLVSLLTLAFSAASAQSVEPAVKIIPAAQPGVFKVIYAYDTDQAVKVKFFNKSGLLELDNVRPEKFSNGFSKKYDVSNIESGDFWVEVAASNISVTYKMTKSKSKKTYQPVLESTTYNNTLTALNN
jgi:opacity protein-like surface antigen